GHPADHAVGGDFPGELEGLHRRFGLRAEAPVARAGIVAQCLERLLQVLDRRVVGAPFEDGFCHAMPPPASAANPVQPGLSGRVARRSQNDSMPLTSACQVTGPTTPSTLTAGMSAARACLKPRTAASRAGPQIPSTCGPVPGSPD